MAVPIPRPAPVTTAEEPANPLLNPLDNVCLLAARSLPVAEIASRTVADRVQAAVRRDPAGGPSGTVHELAAEGAALRHWKRRNRTRSTISMKDSGMSLTPPPNP